jgi:hypothetical protein
MNNFKSLVQQLYRNTLFGNLLSYCYHSTRNRLLPEKYYVRHKYKKVYGVYPDLENPKTLNEKIIWLKLYDRTPLHTQCADKYAVRNYVREKIGEEYLIPLLYTTRDPKDIIPVNIPNEPVVVKTNHDSGGVIFIRDKSNIDWIEIQKKLKIWLKTNYYWRSKEWQYKNIKPRILVEKLLQDETGNIPFDYKIHCFNGKVNMIQVDMGRGTGNHYRNWYSIDWKREPYKWSSPKGPGKYTDPSDTDIEKPETLEEMIRLSQILAIPFTYVRVDWYDLDGQLFFGELTFHHDGGNRPIEPLEWDIKLGSMLNLN